MAQDEKRIDEDWKKQVEREKGDEGMPADDLPPPQADFMSLVAALGAQALIQLGAVLDPTTKKTETNLPAAKYSIDLLGALEEKTTGNLTEEEKRHLEGLLYELRMRYVQTTE
ncbi:MAG: DUF1844 domain-containing protein [Planctomycetota bacterium]